MRLVSFDVGVRNLAFAVLEVGDESSAVVRVLSWRCIAAAPGIAGGKQVAVEAVLRALDELGGELLECDTVLVESQPRFAPLNVQLQHAIATFFILRKRVDLAEPVAVHMVAASLKNRLAAAAVQLGPVAAATRGARYARNKRAAVLACDALVERSGDRLAATWAGFKKKDDAADCMLQAVAWLALPLSAVTLA